jgi:hypothetical protein
MSRYAGLILGLMAITAGSAAAEQYKGVISDAKCGAAHADASEKSAACVKKCVGSGTDPVLVTEGKVMKLDSAGKEKVADYLGKKVVVEGSDEDGTVTITSIKEAED